MARYDVFLSFRGVDTRKNFTGHLYAALCRNGLRTFRDEEELQIGECIESKLLEGIRESRLAVPIFSRNYASSRWCRNELLYMIQCRSMILPVLLDSELSAVGCSKDTSERLDEEGMWMDACREVRLLECCSLERDADGFFQDQI